MFNKELSTLWNTIRSMKREGDTLIIGIDGCGGSGKSTLAEALRKKQPQSVTVIHMDDFFKPSEERANNQDSGGETGADFDWRRLQSQVMEPLRRGEAGRYQRCDWENDKLADWIEVRQGGIVIVEGVTALRRELRENYDYTVWVETPRDTRIKRGIERDGEDKRSVWEQRWMPAEDRYVAEHRPKEAASLIITGEGTEKAGIRRLLLRQFGAAVVSTLTFPIMISVLFGLHHFLGMYLFVLTFSAPAFLIGGTLISAFIEWSKDNYVSPESLTRYLVSFAAYAVAGIAVILFYVVVVLDRLDLNPNDFRLLGTGAALYYYHVSAALTQIRKSSKRAL